MQTFFISKYEVTNAQYAEFLNAVAADDDPHALYNEFMATPTGGITSTQNGGSTSYEAKPGREAMPVNFVSYWDALRFANWMHNGQPTGAQDDSTTEDGAYTLTLLGEANNHITRNGNATIFLTSEDEWYKAAYYDAISTSYFDFPVGSDAQTTCAAPGATPNTANCNGAAGGFTDVGSYTASASPYGTFDQGGSVDEWNEAILGSSRGLRGGTLISVPSRLAASSRSASTAGNECDCVGFRVAMVPEPNTALLVAGGLLALAARGRARPA
jgi:formylglycine-generating enzyme required for sulfatase activity